MAGPNELAVNPPDIPRTIVKFGNSQPMMQRVHYLDEARTASIVIGEPAKHIQQSVTTASMWPGFDDEEFVGFTTSTPNDRMLMMIHRQMVNEHKKYAVGVSECDQIFSVHCGKSAPDWVWASDPDFAKALAGHFNCSPVDQEPSMLVTNAGRDAAIAQILSTAAQPAAFNYLALTASTTAPAVGDTVLTGEITTAGGGLLRAQATYAHTAGTNTATLTKTFTANGSDSLPVVIAQIGGFNAASGGTLLVHTALSSTATLSQSGDNTTVTETPTIG